MTPNSKLLLGVVLLYEKSTAEVVPAVPVCCA